MSQSTPDTFVPAGIGPVALVMEPWPIDRIQQDSSVKSPRIHRNECMITIYSPNGARSALPDAAA